MQLFLVHGQRQLPCELLDLSSGGVAFRLRVDGPPLPIRQRVKLIFAARGLARIITTRGLVRFSQKTGGFHSFGVEFVPA